MIVFFSEISTLLEDLVAEDSCKGSWEAFENVMKWWIDVEKSEKSQGILK